MIRNISRTKDYFQNKLDSQNKKITSNDFDGQFNDISSYLNSIIKPAIDNLVNSTLVGVNGNAGAFLHNVGDGSTDWQKINSDLIDDYSISLKKIAPITTGSVLIANEDGDLAELIPTANHQVLISRHTATPEWRKINANDIANKTLTGSQFGMLAMENFTDNQFITNIIPNIIETKNIQDGAITNNKLINDLITANKLGIFESLPSLDNHLRFSDIEDGAVIGGKVEDLSIPIEGSLVEDIYNLWSNEYGIATYQFPDGYQSFKQLITSDNIKDNSIEDSQLSSEYDEFHFNNTSIEFKFQSNHIALDSLYHTPGPHGDIWFDNEIVQAITQIMKLPWR